MGEEPSAREVLLRQFMTGKQPGVYNIPRYVAVPQLRIPPALPTPLEFDAMLKNPFACSKAGSKKLYRTTAKHGIYVSHPTSGSSGGAVISLSTRSSHPLHDELKTQGSGAPSTPFVSKVCILERMPRDAEHAYLSLIEMATSILSTQSISFVDIETVKHASQVLINQMARDELGFEPSAIYHLASKKSRANCDRVNTKDPDMCVENVGDAYFNMEHLVAAVRLYHLIQDYCVEKEHQRWYTAFIPFLQEAEACGITPDNITNFQVPRIPRVYSHVRNAQFTNELVAGKRVTALYYARLAVGFTPVVDCFYHPLNSVSTDETMVMHIVSERNTLSAVECIRSSVASELEPSTKTFALIRSVFAQLLLTLEAAQEHARFVHYDLHGLNVMLKHATPSMPEYAPKATWRYVRPNHQKDFFIPSSDSNGQAVRIIDYGMSRVDDPNHVYSDDRASSIIINSRPCGNTFDASIDMRSYAHDIVVYGLSSWWSRMPSTTESVEFLQFVEVLEAMTNVKNWNGWADGTSWEYGVCKKYGLEYLTSMADYATLILTGKIKKTVIEDMRASEFIMNRPSDVVHSTPTHILDLPFFSAYTHANGDNNNIVDVANASVTFKDAMGGNTVEINAKSEISKIPNLNTQDSDVDVRLGVIPGSNPKKRRCDV